MAERQKYEQWLQDLEAKRDSTPDKVFERVQADYKARLQEALDGLRQHTSALQEHARSLMLRTPCPKRTWTLTISVKTTWRLRTKLCCLRR